ncbi:hypothetical protein D3C80_2035470 [compost metagenome]
MSAHFDFSAVMKRWYSSVDPVYNCVPWDAKRSFNCGDASVFCKAAFKAASTSGGVPEGA